MICPKKTLYFLYLFTKRQLNTRVLPNFYISGHRILDIHLFLNVFYGFYTSYPHVIHPWLSCG